MLLRYAIIVIEILVFAKTRPDMIVELIPFCLTNLRLCHGGISRLASNNGAWASPVIRITEKSLNMIHVYIYI